MKVIVGLGNPGLRYAQTKHNVGFWVIDRLSDQWGIPADRDKWKAEIGEGIVNNEKVILVKPQTFMNLSGESVRKIIDFFKLDLEDLVVIYDDLDLPVGKIRLRLKGSSGGHNGLKSIIGHLGTDQFNRIKIGIGRPEGSIPVSDYVLTPFVPDQIPSIEEAVEQSAQAVQAWIDVGFHQAMNRFN